MSGSRLQRLAFLLLLAAPACRLPEGTAAEANGRPVAAAELEAEVRSFTAQFGQSTPALEQSLPKLRRGILDRLINRELMLLEAEKRGIRPAAAEVDAVAARAREGMAEKEFNAALAEAGTDREGWRRRIVRDLTIEKLQREIGAAVTVTDREIAERLARRRDRGDLPEEVRASQLLVRSAEEAGEARRRILEGAAFADVARRVSLSPDADRGGDLGYFARGQMPPEFDEVVFALAPGRLSEVVETAYGYHLFLVGDRRPARQRTGDEMRLATRETLLAEKREAAFQAWLTGVRAAARIRYGSATDSR